MNEEPHIGDLLRQLRDDTTDLLKKEVALAKTEMGENLQRTARNIGELAVGAFVASSALVIVLMALAFFLASMFNRRGMDEQAAEGLGLVIVALIAIATSGVLIMKALSALKTHSVAPDRTVQSLREDKQWAQNKLS